MTFIPSTLFYTPTRTQVEALIRSAFGGSYDFQEGILHQGGLISFHVVGDKPSDYAKEEVAKYLSQETYHPNPLVFLTQLSRMGIIPVGNYLI